MNEQDILEGKLDDATINDLRKYIGADSNEQTEAASSAAITTLLGGLSRNAASQNGRSALLSALDRDHDGSILDDAFNILFGRKKAENPRAVNGPGILEHIFGNRQTRVAEGIGRGTGLNRNQVLKLLMTLAPLILGALGKAKNRQSSNGFDIFDFLRNKVLTRNQRMHDNGLLNRLIDSDDDDDGVLDDLAHLERNAFLSR